MFGFYISPTAMGYAVHRNAAGPLGRRHLMLVHKVGATMHVWHPSTRSWSKVKV